MGDGKTDRPDELVGRPRDESEDQAIKQEKKEQISKREQDKILQKMWTRMQRDSWNHMNEIYKRSK